MIAGVAEIMCAAEYLMSHPEIPHGPIKIGFTPDEEIGRGVDHFDVEKFGAKYAYTLTVVRSENSSTKTSTPHQQKYSFRAVISIPVIKTK